MAIGNGARDLGGARLDDRIVDPYLYADEVAYHALFADLRRDDPVHWTAPAGFRPFWTVTKHADISAIELDAANFVNEPRTALAPIVDEEMIKVFTGGSSLMAKTLVHMDGREHRAFRSMTQSWFAPKRLAALEQRIRELARESVDDMLARGGRCDFVDEVALWYPLRVIMHILGVPRSDEQLMLKLTQEIFGQTDPEQQRAEGAAGLIALMGDYERFFNAITLDRRANPRDDVASLIANATVDGEPINQSNAIGYYVIIATAGHDTTSSTSAAGLLQLIRNPGELAKLKENPALMSGFVDEAIRWASPVKHFFRTAIADRMVNGKQIRAGDGLMMCYPSANRDEDVYSDPFTFRIDRGPPRHVAFGYGPHVCLGQHLAKMEIRILFEEMLSRVGDIELDGEPSQTIANFVSGLKHLPIRYRPRSA